MGTRSKTTVFNEDNTPILSIYSQFDGYYDGLGRELQAFLKDRKIVSGFSTGESEETKCSNGMECLAAMLVAKLKEDIGNVYICGHEDTQEYNYEIRHVYTDDSYGHVSLTGSCKYNEDEPTKVFPLYKDEVKPEILRVVEFVYDKEEYGVKPKWRSVEVVEETDKYIKGIESGVFKTFLKERIIDGRINEIVE